MAGNFQKKGYRHFLLFPVGLAIFMTSCVSEEVISVPDTNNPADSVKSGYMKIRLNTPEPHIPTTKTYETRAMDSQAENEIDAETLNVLVFSYNNDGEGIVSETFYYKATISGSVVYDENDSSKATVFVKLMKSISQNDLYSFVVVANHDLSDVEMVRNVTTKQDILEQLTYSVPGKWKADPDNYTLFPMYGESAPVVVSDNMVLPTINLYRALARIDVGLNFVTDNGKLTEQAYGVPGFKLAEVLVFRTFNKGFVASINDNATEITSVPANASRHSDNSPLEYIITDPEGVDVFTREIYVPEANVPLTPDNDNIHCIVAGGYYNNSTNVSYYRLDFANETDPGMQSCLPLLRNHRYVFNITAIKGPGFPSVTSALKSTPAIGNVDYDLVAWDATIHEMETQGLYYFGIDNRSLLAEALSTASDPDNKFTVKYQTNYPLSDSNPLILEWASAINDPLSSPAFDAQWQNVGKNILITVNDDNITTSLITDTLYVHAGSFVKKIVVRQANIQFVIPKMEVLVFSSNYHIDGYAISDNYGGAGKLISSSNNFGTNDNSIVKTEGFKYTTSNTYNFAYSANSDAYKLVTGSGGKIADIVYIAFPAFFDSPTAKLLVEYLDKGGVIVAFIEHASVKDLFYYVFNYNNSISYSTAGRAGSIYPFPAHSSLGLSQNELQNVLQQFDSDPILNGPFGDVRDKQWGQDDVDAVYLRNLPINDPNLTVYSYFKDISSTTPTTNIEGVMALKYESPNRNIVWFGDGGFMTSNDGMPGISETNRPLYWDTNTFFPVFKPAYGWSNKMPVYNSIVFCNIMAWATQKSESLREKRNNAQ